MIILKHPITTDIILVSSSNAEYFAFISNKSSAEFWNQEIIEENDFFTCLLINIIKMDVFGSPFKVVDEFSGAIALLQNERIVEKLRKFRENINVRIVSNSARKLPHFSLFSDKLLWNWIKIASDRLETEEVKLMILIRFEMAYFFTELIKLIENFLNFFNNLFLFMFWILDIAKSFLFEVAL